MSFITKRERVFNEYDLFDLPARNEGKLKAYASCTDARAWSHFNSDKTEHLVEIIKRNNEVCRTKYVPTNVIVDTLMVAKNAEISRLKRKIEEFEQMIAAYDQLELTCDQKCEIANAHASIKAANKELDDLCLNLDISNITECIDSEGFQTGKSSGDEWTKPMAESKSNQYDLCCTCDKSTHATDPRIDEMQDAIIHKDAKLSAMQNTLAVMENDVCEPYCIYAHIYTALEKIFGILCQNDKYRLYLNLLTSGRDTRCIDIKGKILYKLKVLEKFSLALIAPCSQEFKDDNAEVEDGGEDCACYHAEIITHVQSLALTTSDTKLPSIDNKRAKLVADIMDNLEMKEILDKKSSSGERLVGPNPDDLFVIDDYNIETENLNRLKNLQVSYDELMTCYESIKHERDCLQIRCQKYDELEKEYEILQGQVREYNALWNEKEHFRRRSEDLDNLKEQYLMLTEETSNLETQLKAESEIISIKTDTIDDLRSENINLEKKINDAAIIFEREKNSLQCKLKECECKVMCQEQQIKSLSEQIDRLLEQDHGKLREDTASKSIELIDEMESMKEQIKNLQDALYCSEEEKLQLQKQFQDQLKTINDLKIKIEDWKSAYEKILQHNNYLENITDSYKDEINKLREDNQHLTLDVEEKNTAVANLLNVINNKSQEFELKQDENRSLLKQLQAVKHSQNSFASELEHEKIQVQLARQESQELLEKIKNYTDVVHENENLSRYLTEQNEDCKELKKILNETIGENKRLQADLESRENNNAILLQEIQRLREVNGFALASIHNLREEKDNYKSSLDMSKKESQILEVRLSEFEALRDQLQNVTKSRDKLLDDKNKLENELREKAKDLNNAMQSFDLTRKESDELMLKVEQSENLRDDLMKLSEAYHRLVTEKQMLQRELDDKNGNLQNMLQKFDALKNENEDLLSTSKAVVDLERELSKLKDMYNKLMAEKNILQNNFDNKTQEIQHLYSALENKIDENRELGKEIKRLQDNENNAKMNIDTLQGQHVDTRNKLEAARKESLELLDKLKNYENLEKEFDKLKQIHKQALQENEKLQNEFNKKMGDFKIMAQENIDLANQSQSLMKQNENLEKFVTELVGKQPTNDYEYIMKEIENLKNEKLKNQSKIRDLLDKLDLSENIISSLNEDLSARNDKIAILENHINSLEDEIRKLHRNLQEAVDAGEELTDSSHIIDQSRNTLEAHHSKATHNMKMEIAKLQNYNAKLEQQLSVTKKMSKDSLTDKHKYVSQVMHFEKEREIIVTEIKQLELDSVGDTKLSPEHCSTPDILHSLERIRTYLQAINNKSNSLEHTILKVQTSSQLLLSKADEAKRLVEKEKQKIINEKEEAIAARLNMEKQLLALKEQLEQQSNDDKRIIKNLEAEILNQELIINRINSSTNDYINKLKEELNALQDLYQKSLEKVNELQDKINNMNKEQVKNSETISKLSQDYNQKLKEVENLTKILVDIQNKKQNNTGVQVKFLDANEVVATQTDRYPQYSENEPKDSSSKDLKKENMDDELTDISILKVHKPAQEKIKSHLLPSQTPQSFNEVQILTANVEPSLAFVKNSYLNYKLKRLSHGRLEQYSISADNIESHHGGSVGLSHSFDNSSNMPEKFAGVSNPHLVDIFNRQSIHTDSSKEKSIRDSPISLAKDQHSGTKTSNALTNDTFGSDINNSNNANNMSNASSSGKSNKTDKDIFVIYRDSDTKQQAKASNDVEDNPDKTKHINAKTKKASSSQKIKRSGTKDKSNLEEDDFLDEGESNKLNINMPKIPTESHSTISAKAGNHFLGSTSKIDKPKKFSSDSLNYIDNQSTSTPKESNLKDKDPSQSKHRLSRIDGNFILIDKNDELNNAETPRNKPDTENNFGLEYIMDSVQREVNPEHRQIVFGDDAQTSSTASKVNLSKVMSGVFPKLDDHIERDLFLKEDSPDVYHKQIQYLTKCLKTIEQDYKKKIGAIKMQYDNNIKNIINEHNQGVASIQCLHEETLQDILKIHENEVENLRSMSMEAMRKSETLERENVALKCKIQECCGCVDEEPVKIAPDTKKRKCRSRNNMQMLTKTNVEAFNVKPKVRSHGPCTCSLDVNISDTIRNLFEQVDVEQRKVSEHTYLKYIANKIMSGNVEALDAQELSFLHLKVCRTWKSKMNKEDVLQKKIDSLENELMHKQRHAQEHIAELDRKVALERRRLQEVREAVCMSSSPRNISRPHSPEKVPDVSLFDAMYPQVGPEPELESIDQCYKCKCTSVMNLEVGERRSAGDLPVAPPPPTKSKRVNKIGNNRAVLAKFESDERREKRFYNDEPPTRLRRVYDRNLRTHKK